MKSDQLKAFMHIVRETWPEWVMSPVEEAEWKASFVDKAFERSRLALHWHREESIDAPAADLAAVERLYRFGPPRSDAENEFRRWWRGNPPYHLTQCSTDERPVPDQTAIRLRRWMYQRDLYHRAIYRGEPTEKLTLDDIRHRLEIIEGDIERLGGKRPESLERAAASYETSGYMLDVYRDVREAEYAR